MTTPNTAQPDGQEVLARLAAIIPADYQESIRAVTADLEAMLPGVEKASQRAYGIVSAFDEMTRPVLAGVAEPGLSDALYNVASELAGLAGLIDVALKLSAMIDSIVGASTDSPPWQTTES